MYVLLSQEIGRKELTLAPPPPPPPPPPRDVGQVLRPVVLRRLHDRLAALRPSSPPPPLSGAPLIPEKIQCVKVAKDLDITYLGPLGCGVQTGAGTVLNVLKPKPTEHVAVWGLGGVGISALLATKSLGVKTIIAVDIIQSRLDLALELGATYAIHGMDKDIPEQIAKITGGDMLDFV